MAQAARIAQISVMSIQAMKQAVIFVALGGMAQVVRIVQQGRSIDMEADPNACGAEVPCWVRAAPTVQQRGMNAEGVRSGGSN